MRKFLARIFHRLSVEDVLRDQLFEADRLHVEHMAAAEVHLAFAGLYAVRAERIRARQTRTAELRAVK